MNRIRLIEANSSHQDSMFNLSLQLNKKEHIELKREEKISTAISKKECFVILMNEEVVGFLLFNYSFFDNGWIDLIIIEKKYRGKGIAVEVFQLIGSGCKTEKLFTSTNRSNNIMQKALNKSGFVFAGELTGLDEGDPELFYYKKVK